MEIDLIEMTRYQHLEKKRQENRPIESDMKLLSYIAKSVKKIFSFLSFFLSLYTATRPRGHSRQVGAASVSIRQKKLKYSKE